MNVSTRSRSAIRMLLTSMVPLFLLAHFSHHVVGAITAPLLPMIRAEFSLSYAQSGLMLAAFTLAYGAGHLVVGWLMERIPPRVFIVMGISVAALFGLLIGVAGSFALLLTFQFLLGLAGAGYHPASTMLISRSVAPENRGRALGVHIIGGSASFFLSPLLASAIASVWSWRGAFLLLSAPTIAIGIVLYILLERNAGSRAGMSSVRSERPAEGAGPAPIAVVIAVLALTTIGGSLIMSPVSYIPLYAVDALGVPQERAATLLAFIFSAGLWVAPLAGTLSDRIGRLPLLIGVSLIVGPVVAGLTVAPMGLPFFGLLALMGVYICVRMPTSESFILGEVDAKHRSTVLGLYFLGSSAGTALFTPLLGRIADAVGFPRAFRLVALLFLALTLLCGIVIVAARRGVARRAGAGRSPRGA